MADAPQAALDLVAKLKLRFLERAKGEREQLASLGAATAAVGCSPETFKELQRLTHSLHGTGGTFGFPEISERAGAVEDICRAKLEPDIAPALSGDLPAAMRALLDAMDKALASG